MNPGQFKVCTDCPHVVWGNFTTMGTDHLEPQIELPGSIGWLLMDGWTVTYHDHERRRA